MPTKEQNDAMVEYAGIMEEIKIRIDVISSLTKNNSHYPARIVTESCYLQLRLICECVSLACLVAHGDIKEIASSKLQGAFAADYIVNQLEKLHPDFYPTPYQRYDEGPGHYHLDNFPEPYLDRDKLVALTRSCGNVVHRGSLKKLLKKKNPAQFSYPEIEKHVREIVGLLDSHYIRLVGGNIILCVMRGGEGGSVQVAFAEQKPR